MAGKGWIRGKPIGRGTTATVFLATRFASGDVFAVKSAELSRSALLQREQSILSALSSPAIISCLGFDVGTCDGGAIFYNLFLEYATGGSLAGHIKRDGHVLNEKDVSSKTGDILAGLAYLHGHGVVHCDVKPENVLIVSGGRAKIGDLGCARWIVAGEREVRGTPMYMAPEAARGEEQGMPADIWSLGCTVIEMVTGRPPWPESADTIRRIGFSDDLPEIPTWVADDARDFLGKCLRRNPSERWKAEELLRHPFIAGTSSPGLSWVSPKSTLDFSLWESMEEDEEESEEKEGFCDNDLPDRIQDLATVSGSPNWTWDEEWLEVRNVVQEFTEEVKAFAGTNAAATTSSDGTVDGWWNVDAADPSISGGKIPVEASKVGSVSCKFGHFEKASFCKLPSNYRIRNVIC